MIRLDLMLNRSNEILRKMSAEVKKHKFSRPLYSILFGIGLIYMKRHLFGYLHSLWLYRHPTRKMENEKRFFSEHIQELKKVYNSLENEQSRSVFENILKYRITYNWAYLKNCRTKGYLKNQYLVPELPFSDREVIVDCGAYDGDTAKLFNKKIPGCRIISLEPSEKNFEALQKLKLEGLQPIQAGAWSEDTTLNFSDKGGGSTSGAINASGTAKIIVKALDHLSECQSATYIKMDIEGAELEALKGAEKTIKRQKPKLAICIYHRPQDFFEIPLYIKKLNPNYKLYIYHHTYEILETVLYAV